MVTGASAHADRTKGRRVDILVWAAAAVVAILAMAAVAVWALLRSRNLEI